MFVLTDKAVAVVVAVVIELKIQLWKTSSMGSTRPLICLINFTVHIRFKLVKWTLRSVCSERGVKVGFLSLEGVNTEHITKRPINNLE